MSIAQYVMSSASGRNDLLLGRNPNLRRKHFSEQLIWTKKNMRNVLLRNFKYLSKSYGNGLLGKGQVK